MNFTSKLLFQKNYSQCEVRCIYANDVNEDYIEGLRRQTSYIKNIPNRITLKKQKDYVRNIDKSDHDCILGLFLDGQLIGTSGVQNADGDNEPSIGVFIFNTEVRGLGLGKALIWASCYILREIFHTEEMYAGMKKSNIPSYKSFLSCGFIKNREDEDTYYVKGVLSELIKPDDISETKLE